MSPYSNIQRFFASQSSVNPVANSRLIPTSTSSLVYKNHNDEINHLVAIGSTQLPGSRPHSTVSQDASVEISLREDMMFLRGGISSMRGGIGLSMPEDLTSDESINSDRDIMSGDESSRKSTHTSPLSPHHEIIAHALGLSQNAKVFQFSSPTKRQKKSSGYESGSLSSSNENSGSSIRPNTSLDPVYNLTSLAQQSISSLPCSKPENKDKTFNSIDVLKNVKTLVAINVLQAPGLRNDFYSNLVSWSPMTNKITVGLGSNAYVWGTDNLVQMIPLNCLQYDSIACVSSSGGTFSIVTTGNGNIYLINQLNNKVVSFFNNEGACVFVVKWFPDGKLLFLGDELGVVTYYEISLTRQNEYKLIEISSLKNHRQQICGN